jgi:hypothetical protein
MKPLCFVLMPFGRKAHGSGRMVDFDAVYEQILGPAAEAAGMDVIRADQEQVGGTIHKPMYERLMLSDYAIADVTGANPNVYYELGIRHALRPRSTVMVFADGTMLPFDVASQRGTPYHLDDNGNLSDVAGDLARVTDRLKNAYTDTHDDSPLFQLIDGMPRHEIDHIKTDVFRDRVAFSQDYKKRLTEARAKGVEAVRAIAADPNLKDLRNVQAGIVVDMMLSFRAVGTEDGWEEMVKLYDRMPPELQKARMIREQLGFALNRLKRHQDAERVLTSVIEEYGDSSETNGLLGRVYKDLWDAAKAEGRSFEARGHLKRAIATYRAGFEADWRDPYPGINAVTLMEMEDKPSEALEQILPVVRYAASQRVRKDRDNSGDYWDHATLLELDVLARDQDAAMDHAGNALAVVREPWEPRTTARNLRLIREMRSARGEDSAWIAEIEEALHQAEERLMGPSGST